jgi:uncharacterized repeat protein (TIGR01451 family)
VRSSLLKLYTGTGATFDSIVSLVVNAEATRVVYDHWEDGYEVDLNAPLQSTTRIWGDGNNANGIAPGFVNDPASLSAGTVFSLRNNVTLPRSPATVLYDGRDRVGATKAIVISRAAWAITPGSVLAGAVEVSSILDYGTQFISPVGENVSAASMFEVVDLYVMAAENGTTVNIDKDANGSFETVTSLNRGESYRVNGGVLKGARVSTTKPVQAHLITGDIGANYESRWLTLYPVEQWSPVYYTPVGTAADGDPAYVFLYNPGTGALPVRVTTLLGSTDLSVASNGVLQYQVPQNSGAKFASTNGLPFFAAEVVGANPSANNVHDWGFTLVPEGNLTTIAMVGWGPGSSDLSQNGSPVWVTAVADTTLYVDFDGDRAGPLTDGNGDGYDTNLTISALQSLRIYDPDKDQTAMRVYTLDGTLITAAWGQDPAVAGAGNPFLDLGTTVLPFPQAVIRKASTLYTDNSPVGLSTNDVLEYTITIDNNSVVVLGNVIVLDAPPPSLSYMTNSSMRDAVPVADDLSPATVFPFDEGGYVIPVVPRGGSVELKYRARILASGSIVNAAGQGDQTVTNVVEVPGPAGSSPCNLDFTDGAGNAQATYAAGAGIYVTLTDADANTDAGVVETVSVTVQDPASGDLETILLTEVSANTNVFRNLAALPSSASTGVGQQDGTLYVAAGQTLAVAHTDPVFGDVCSDTAIISAPSAIKVLYLSTDGSGSPDQDLDRIDPVASGDTTTATSVVLSAAAPNAGTGTVVVQAADLNANDSDVVYVGVATFSGANATTPIFSSNSSVGTTSPGSVVVTSATGHLVFDVMALDDARPATNAAAQSSVWNAIGGALNDGIRAGASTRAGAALVTNQWTLTADSWALTAVSIKPATGGGGTNRTTFTQTPVAVRHPPPPGRWDHHHHQPPAGDQWFTAHQPGHHRAPAERDERGGVGHQPGLQFDDQQHGLDGGAAVRHQPAGRCGVDLRSDQRGGRLLRHPVRQHQSAVEDRPAHDHHHRHQRAGRLRRAVSRRQPGRHRQQRQYAVCAGHGDRPLRRLRHHQPGPVH